MAKKNGVLLLENLNIYFGNSCAKFRISLWGTQHTVPVLPTRCLATFNQSNQHLPGWGGDNNCSLCWYQSVHLSAIPPRTVWLAWGQTRLIFQRLEWREAIAFRLLCIFTGVFVAKHLPADKIQFPQHAFATSELCQLPVSLLLLICTPLSPSAFKCEKGGETSQKPLGLAYTKYVSPLKKLFD